MAPPTLLIAQGLFGRCFKQLARAQILSRAVLTPALLVGASLVIGYLLGSSTLPPTMVVSEENDGDSSVEEVSDGDLSAITAALLEPCKMVRHSSYQRSVLRKDYRCWS